MRSTVIFATPVNPLRCWSSSFLYNDNSSNSDLVAQKRYLKSVPLKERSPEALVKGWDQALQEIVVALAADLKSMNLNSKNSIPPVSPDKDMNDAAESR